MISNIYFSAITTNQNHWNQITLEGGTMSKPFERSSVRSGRRKSREREAVAAPPYITRKIPPYEIASEESLIAIEHAADRILAETGMEIRDDEVALELFRKAGAQIDGVNVKFEPGMLREILKSVPKQFTQHARNPKKSVELGGNHVVFTPAYGSPFVMDLDKGRRYGTIEDFQNFIKLAYSSQWLHHSGGTICEPVDIPVNKTPFRYGVFAYSLF